MLPLRRRRPLTQSETPPSRASDANGIADELEKTKHTNTNTNQPTTMKKNLNVYGDKVTILSPFYRATAAYIAAAADRDATQAAYDAAAADRAAAYAAADRAEAAYDAAYAAYTAAYAAAYAAYIDACKTN